MSTQKIEGLSSVLNAHGIYTWNIKNLKSWLKFNSLQSPSFMFPDIIKTPWYLELSPPTSTSNNFCGIQLVLINSTSIFSAGIVKISFYTKSSTDERANKHSAFHRFFSNYLPPRLCSYSYDRFLPLDLLTDDTLMIFCEILQQCPIKKMYFTKSELQNVDEQRAKLALDLNSLLKSEQFSDTVLISSCGKKFQVHKNILAARSAVFSAMFENDMKEKQENVVEITDIDAETLEELILFIYTGKINNPMTAAMNLLAAADKYDIEGLKILCEKVLNEIVAIDNAVDILILADLHRTELLKQKVLHFITKHLKSIMDTPAFKTLMNGSYSHLIIEIFGDIYKNNENPCD